MRDLPRLTSDGLSAPEVGGWCEDKYRYFGTYAEIFAKATKKDWPCRVYVDLFAGAGRSTLRESGAIVPGSPLLALAVPDPFDKYVFCDADQGKLDVLRQRVTREYPQTNVEFLLCDVNESVDQVLAAIPQHRPGAGVLSFVFADPYGLEGLRFATIEKLARRRADFMVLIPSGMEVNRFWKKLSEPGNPVLDEFLGTTEWRKSAKTTTLNPMEFICEQYSRRMSALGFRGADIAEARHVRSTDKNLPLYHLMLFSKSDLVDKLRREALKYSDPQRGLFG